MTIKNHIENKMSLEGEFQWETRWKIFKWEMPKNPFVPDWINRVAALNKQKAGIENAPLFKKMYLGKWRSDDRQETH